MTLTLDGKLLLAPVPKDQTLHRVIDVGCGTGIWAMVYTHTSIAVNFLNNQL